MTALEALHDQVFLRTYFPDQQLDALLNLENRVRRKLAQAAASVGVEVTPIERGAEGHQSFSETRDEIERLHRNYPTIYERGGTESAAQSGEEYRQELRKALARRGDEIPLFPGKPEAAWRKETEEDISSAPSLAREYIFGSFPGMAENSLANSELA